MVSVDRIPRTSSIRRANTTFGARPPAPSGGPKNEHHDAGEKSDDDVDAVPDVEMFTLIEKELGSA
jgi:hypothetical protein